MTTKVSPVWGWVGAVALAALMVTGCKTGPAMDSAFEPVPDMEPGVAESTAATAAATSPDKPASPGAPHSGTVAPPTHDGLSYERIEPGDAITVYFADTPNTTPPLEIKVREDGTITLLLNQTFHAAGKTVGELEREIRERYVPTYYVNLTVSIHLQNTFYFVGGEVKSPSKQQYTGRTTVIKAIQSAGDFTDFAQKKKVKITRSNGKVQIVNVVKALDHPELDLEVYPGDKIYVPRRLL